MLSIRNCNHLGSCTKFEIYNIINPNKDQLKRKIQWIVKSRSYNYKYEKCILQVNAIDYKSFWGKYFGKPVFRYRGCGGEVNIYIIKLPELCKKLDINIL